MQMFDGELISEAGMFESLIVHSMLMTLLIMASWYTRLRDFRCIPTSNANFQTTWCLQDASDDLG